MKLSKTHTLVLSKDDIQNIILHYGINHVMDELIKELYTAIKAYDSKSISIPARSGFNYEHPQTGLIEWMPVYQHGGQIVIKVVGYHPHNPILKNLPTIISTISSYDSATGHLEVIMDGVLTTALRTAAASAVATKAMAHPESAVLGLIGCGAQSITQLHGIARLFPIKKVLIYDIDESILNSFENRISSLDLNLTIVKSTIAEIVSSSDILCTATSIEVDEGPLFSNIESKKHIHINAVGSDFPGKTELPLELLKKSFVCVDFLEQALIEGECQQLSSEDVGANLTDLLKDEDQSQHIKEQCTVFDSTGWALEDQVVLNLFMKYAQNLGLGQKIAIENISGDAKGPYNFLNKVKATTKEAPIDISARV